MLKESVERLVAERYGTQQPRVTWPSPRAAAPPCGSSMRIWDCWRAVRRKTRRVRPGPGETMIVTEAFGRALILEPYFATVVLAAAPSLRQATRRCCAALVPNIVEGSLILALAHEERQARYELARGDHRALRRQGWHTLDGEKTVVLGGDSADKLIVSARAPAAARDRGGIGLFLVDAEAPGVTRRATRPRTTTARPTSRSPASGSAATRCWPAGQRPRVVEHAIEHGIAAVCGRGARRAWPSCVELTVVHQDPQAVRRADRLVPGAAAPARRHADEVEQARSMAYYATTVEPDAAARRKATAAAKARSARPAGSSDRGRSSSTAASASPGGPDRPLLQADDGHHHDVRRRRSPRRASWLGPAGWAEPGAAQANRQTRSTK